MIIQCTKCGAEKVGTPQTILAYEPCDDCPAIGSWIVLRYIRCVCGHDQAINRLADENEQICEECSRLGEFTDLPF